MPLAERRHALHRRLFDVEPALSNVARFALTLSRGAAFPGAASTLIVGRPFRASATRTCPAVFDAAYPAIRRAS